MASQNGEAQIEHISENHDEHIVEVPDDENQEEEQFIPSNALDTINRHLNCLTDQYPILDINSTDAYHEMLSLKEEIDFLKAKFYSLGYEVDEHAIDFEFYHEIRSKVISITSKINSKLSKYEDQQRQLNQPSVVHTSPVQPQPVMHQSYNVRLPDIPLPKFDGSFNQWLNFKSTFTSLVINNSTLDDTLRYHYLRQALSLEALNRIANSPSGNFQLAWNLLATRYDNLSLIAETHLNSIFNPPRLDTKSAQSWRAFIDHQKTNIFALEALSLQISIKDLIFMHLTVSKFDTATLRDWERFNSLRTNVTLDHLWEFLESQHKISQAVSFNSNHNGNSNNNNSNNNQRSNSSNQQNNNKQPFHSKPGNNYYQSANVFNRTTSCLFCGNPSHNVFNCPTFSKIPIAERGKAVRQKSLCFNCLRPFGPGHQCTSQQCRTCSKAHHTMLHGSPLPYTSFPGNANVNNVRTRSNNRRSYCHNTQSDSYNQSSDSQLSLTSVDNSFIPSSTTPQSMHNDTTSHHQASVPNTQVVSASSTPLPAPQSQSVSNSNCTSLHDDNVNSVVNIMPTVQLLVLDNLGQPVFCRALLDSGSDSCFLSKNLAARLQLRSIPKDNTVHTVSGSNSAFMHVASVNIHSPDRTWSKEISCILTNKITPSLPPTGLNIKCFNIPPNIKLADPQFFQLQGVDVLLSVSIYASLITVGQLQLSSECILQNTKLGWVVWGALSCNKPVCNEPVQSLVHSNFVSTSQISKQLEKFWKLEEISPEISIPTEQAKIEQHFIENVQRLENGRFSVALPKKDSFHSLGQSHFQALKRFHSLEKRFESNPELKEQYTAFMEEYQELGHMSPAPPAQPDEKCYHIPHHPVFKPDSTTTKMRVVFDASAKSNTGTSLNDVLHVGPTVQSELYDIVLRFRTHRVAFISDVNKMYRQILIHFSDRTFQRIFWRSDPNQPVQEYFLNTVSYGTSSAPYLATRTLNHLADVDCTPDSPVSVAIKNDFYVDDLISGASSVTAAVDLVQQLLKTLSNGGFELRKWLSNSPEVMEAIPSHLVETVSSKPLSDSNDSVVKALGLIWNSTSDQLIISSSISEAIHKTSFTKRELLSCISSIFDPLGLISPIVILPKMLFQKLWLLKIDWDHKLPSDLLSEWLAVLHELPNIANITIPRCVLPQEIDITTELHAFCDASANAYGACLYIRSVSSSGVQVRLLTSKSRVASLNPLLTIPRLELQAAFLASRLVIKAINAAKLNFSGVYLWTDSKIVCDWLKALPNRSDVFVSVRISAIQNMTSEFTWKHVKSSLNPADLVSRGCSPNTLISNKLWWNGPPWLMESQSTWTEISSNVAILKPVISLATHVTPSIFSSLINRISEYHKLIRAAAYVLRFVHNLKSRSDPVSVLKGPLSVQEVQTAELKILQAVQHEAFHDEINQLNQHKELLANHSLKPLTPFIHTDSLLRVGGRLNQADVPFDFKHQILLPSKHKFTRALIISYHRRVKHDGVQSTMSALRQRYWIPSTRRTIKNVLKSCKICFRFSKLRSEQIMGQLPAVRVQSDFPFYKSGVDYAGPISIRVGGPKSRVFSKAYLALFVCMVTRAVHVEVVSELSTKIFLAALGRFTARRGIPYSIHSDNATTFVGANNELQELHDFFASPETQKEIYNFTSILNISWHFIPPRAPHFGGLWENAVKNFKKIFRVVTLNAILNYEELNTFSAQIEAILNSRPLTPLTEDPNDLRYISPAHFLIGRPLTVLPFHVPTTTHVDNRSRWRQLQAMTQDLWERWTKEYLVTLQKKGKWTSESENLKVGTVVILKDPGTTPSAWKLGRIVEVHPGQDQKVRVVTVLTPAGNFKRAISSLAPLPFDEEETE